MRRAAAFVVCASFVAGACFYGVPDLAGGGSNSGEGGIGDGSVSGDGSIADAQVDATPFCSSLDPPANLCFDFDEDAALDNWGIDPVVPDQGTAGLDTSTFLSPPQSLDVSVGVGQSSVRYILLTETPHYKPTMRVELVFKSSGSPKNVVRFAIQSVTNGQEEDIGMSFAPNGNVTVTDMGAFPDGGTTFGTGHSQQAVALNEWNQVTLSLAYLAGDGGATLKDSLTVNGTMIESMIPDLGIVPDDLVVNLALYGDSQSSTAAADLHFDNIAYYNR